MHELAAIPKRADDGGAMLIHAGLAIALQRSIEE